MEQRWRWILMAGYMVILILTGAFWPSELPLGEAYYRVITSSGVLITDFMAIAGVQVALINAGVVGLIGAALIWVSRTNLSGPTIAAVFTMSGFAMFGKTPLNILPVLLGVALSARFKGETFRNYIVVALFGTALGPVVSQVAFGHQLGIIPGALVGLLVGFILPALAPHVLHNHQGFNLYNVGFTCGIVGTYVTAHLKLTGLDPQLTLHWFEQEQAALRMFFTVFFLSMVLVGWSGRQKAKEIFRTAGTLVTDFVSEQGFFPALFNMGLVGLMGMGYIMLVGGSLNGPTIGGVFTIVGFGAFGKHVRNIWPLMLGVFLAAQVSIWQAAAPGPLLAALFGTTLAPIAGSFGPLAGLLAGAVHLAVVMHVGAFHAGMNLYNNGFAGGLVGTLFVAVSRWLNLRALRG